MSIIIYLYVRVYRYTIYVYIVYMHMYIHLKHTYITLPFTKVHPKNCPTFPSNSSTRFLILMIFFFENDPTFVFLLSQMGHFQVSLHLSFGEVTKPDSVTCPIHQLPGDVRWFSAGYMVLLPFQNQHGDPMG